MGGNLSGPPATMVGMRIRPAVSTDAAGIARVQVESWRSAYRGLIEQDYLDSLDVDQRRRRWERILAESVWPRCGTFVAEDDERRLVGFGSIGPTRDDEDDPALVGQLAALYLVARVWGTGTGRALMLTCLAALGAAGYREATLWVLATNDRARRFYSAGGWRPDGARKQEDRGAVTLDEVRYRRPVS